MSVPLYMDQHVHGDITRGLRSRGVDVLTTFEDGTADWDDEDLLIRATSLGRFMFTQDDDFLAITTRWLQAGREFAGLAYARQHRISVGQAINDLEIIARASDPDDVRDQVIFLPFS